ncbi:MAG: efflux transporter periplasmic adaptor subunit, partial [Deltaproteobacteria bacterium]
MKEEDTHNHAEDEIHLTAEQLKSAKIKLGKIEKRIVRERIEVTGSIEAPPQSKATIHAPLEAFVYQADLLLGDKVRKGQTIAILQ